MSNKVTKEILNHISKTSIYGKKGQKSINFITKEFIKLTEINQKESIDFAELILKSLRGN